MVKPGDPGGPGDPPGGSQKERDALKKVVLHSFGVTPLQSPVFGTVTAKWNVTVPTIDETGGIEIGLQLNKQPVAATGTQTFTVIQDTVFTLAAVVADEDKVGRTLRQWTVHVNLSECQSESLPALLVTAPIKNVLTQAFGSDDQFSVNGDIEVTPDTGVVNINVPLNINVPNWFDADMDIRVQLAITGGKDPIVTAPKVDVNVDWGFLSNLLSLGCTDLIGSGMSQISKVFLEHIIDFEVRPAITQGLAALRDQYLGRLQSDDPQKRTYVMRSLTFGPDPTGITILACPMPA